MARRGVYRCGSNRLGCLATVDVEVVDNHVLCGLYPAALWLEKGDCRQEIHSDHERSSAVNDTFIDLISVVFRLSSINPCS